MTIEGIYVDDEPMEQTYAELLSDPDGNIKFTAITDLTNLTDLRDQILSNKPKIIALDYRLDENLGTHNGTNDFKGGALAQALREKQDDGGMPACPIILVSNERKIEEYFKPEKTTHDLFDEYYSKETITRDLQRVTDELIAMASGYALISSVSDQDDLYSKLFMIAEEEWEYVGADDLIDDIKNSKYSHIKSRYILRNFIKRNGPLLSRGEILARLGVDLRNDDGELQKLFEQLEIDGIKYNGIYSGGWERYWTHRFEDWCFNLLDEERTAIASKDKVKTIKEKYSIDLNPAESLWTKSSDEVFSFLCANCQHPTELRYSLAIYDPEKPIYSDGKRVCFTCVKTDSYKEKDFRIAKSDQRVRDKIHLGLIKGA